MKLMTKFLATSCMVVALAGSVWAADTKSQMPEMPKPGPEHAWLQQMVGEWSSSTEMTMEPGKAPVKVAGSESIKPLGGFWTITEVQSTMEGQPFKGNMTLGYDADKKKYVGTWVDTMTGQLWEYEGSVDAGGKVLTLESEGKCPMQPGKLIRFKETIEMKDKNHKVFTSSMQGDDGKWVTMMTSTAERK